jgi:uncharacterized protein HemY
MVWIIVAGVVVVLVVVLVNRRVANQTDLGWVTERWLSEYRGDRAADSK